MMRNIDNIIIRLVDERISMYNSKKGLYIFFILKTLKSSKEQALFVLQDNN
jgi:hypothetical protein